MRHRARVEAWRRAFAAEAEATIANRRNDSGTAAYTQKVSADHLDYKQKVAEPTMKAVDGLPAEYRNLVKQYDYVDVYRAWLRKWPPARIRDMAERMGGRFVL